MMTDDDRWDIIGYRRMIGCPVFFSQRTLESPKLHGDHGGEPTIRSFNVSTQVLGRLQVPDPSAATALFLQETSRV